jgi:hypothetical protein
MVAERKEFNDDQYLDAFGPSPAASLALMVVVDSRDMCESGGLVVVKGSGVKRVHCCCV